MSGDHTQGIWRQLSPASADDSGSWTESVLYAFQGLPIDGSIPDGAIALVHGSVYGSTEGGADSTYYAGPFNAPEGCGIIFQLTAPSTPGGAWKGLVAKRRDSKYEPSSSGWAVLPQATNKYLASPALISISRSHPPVLRAGLPTVLFGFEIAQAFRVSSQVIAGILGAAERRLACLG
jgi:hypothetical protein